MMIRVIYTDGKYDMVKPQWLDDLLDRNKVTGFKRSTGWVFVGKDSIRRGNSEGYWGEERRAI